MQNSNLCNILVIQSIITKLSKIDYSVTATHVQIFVEFGRV